MHDVPGGRRIDYKLNGFLMALITYVAFFSGSYLGFFKATIIYGPQRCPWVLSPPPPPHLLFLKQITLVPYVSLFFFFASSLLCSSCAAP